MLRSHSLLPLVVVVVVVVVVFTLQKTHASRSPQFLAQPSNITAHLSATLPCTASGDPSPAITWFKDGSPLSPTTSPDYTLSQDGSLLVESLQEAEGERLEGRYFCVASNSVGAIRSKEVSLTRTVWNPGFSPPSSLTPMTVIRFTSLELSCRAPLNSVPQANVSWDVSPTPSVNAPGKTLDGRLVFSAYTAGRTTVTCSITNPVSGESVVSSRLLYTEITNGAQLIHNTALVVPPAPSQTVVVGEDAILECFTSGSPMASLNWSKDGTPINAATDQHYETRQDARQLVIIEAEPGHAGTYTCQAVSASGDVSVSASGDVIVVVPPLITASFPEAIFNVSQTLSISCSAQGTPPLLWLWRHNGVELVPEAGLQYEGEGPSSTLVMSSATEEEGGVYECVSKQPATGREDTHHQLIEIRVVSPVFTTSSTFPDVLALAGTTVTIPCMATGLPPPTFTWVRVLGSNSFSPVSLEGRYSIPAPGMGDGSLTITSAMLGDSGVLSCEASNSLNSAPLMDGTVVLRVLAMPTISFEPTGFVTPPPGNRVDLSCSGVISGADIRYRWTKDGVVLGDLVRESGGLTIPAISADQADNGVYVCSLVISRAGVSSAPIIKTAGTVTVTVGARPSSPSPPPNLLSSSVGIFSFSAGWGAPLDSGGLNILNYTVEILNRGNPSFCPILEPVWTPVLTGISASLVPLEVRITRDVHPGLEYQFRVKAFTSLFNSLSEPSPSFRSQGSAPQAPPTNIRIETISSEDISISWAPPTSCLDYGGPITSYIIQYQPINDSLSISKPVTTPLSNDIIMDTLSGLIPNTQYQIRIAASTDLGAGPQSHVVMATTRAPETAPPTGPASLTGEQIGPSSIRLSWEAPPTSPGRTLLNYNISYLQPDGTRDGGVTLDPAHLNYTVEDLVALGQYTFEVGAVYSDGLYPSSMVAVTLIGQETSGILSQPWFLGVVAVGGALFVTVVMVILICICYQCCKMGHYKVNSSQNSHFPNKSRQTLPHVVLHGSPTPSRRSTDYAVPELRHNIPRLNSGGGVCNTTGGGRSSGPPSTTNLTSSGMSSPQFYARNGFYQHFDENTRNEDVHNGGITNLQQQQHQHQHQHQHQQQQQQHQHGTKIRSNTVTSKHFQNDHMQNGDLGNGISDMNRFRFQPYHDASPSIQDLSYDSNSYHSSTLDSRLNHVAEDLRRESASTTQRFVDTLSRVHTPPPSKQAPPPQDDFSSSYLARNLSDDKVDPPWNPGELLNARGHMTNRDNASRGHHMNTSAAVGKSDSFRSTESSTSMEFRGPSQLGMRPQLAPLQEHHHYNHGNDDDDDVDFYEESRDYHGKQTQHQSYLTDVDQIRMEELGRGQSSWQRGRDERAHLSYGDITEHHHGNMDMPPRHLSHSDVSNHHGNSVPIITSYGPQTHMSHSKSIETSLRHAPPLGHAPPEPEYAVPPSRPTSARPGTEEPPSIYNYPAPSYAAPPPPEDERNFYPLHSNEQRLKVYPLHPSQLPGGMELEHHNYKVPTPVNGNSLSRDSRMGMEHYNYKVPMATSDMGYPSLPRSGVGMDDVPHLHILPLDSKQTLSPPEFHAPPPPLATPLQGLSPHQSSSSLDGSIGSGWSLDKIQQSMEMKARNFDSMLAPLQEGMETTPRHQPVANGNPISVKPPTLPKPKTAPKPRPTKAPKPHPFKARSPPPDVVQSSGNYGYSSSEDEDSIAINKKKSKVPDLTSMDPRKPRLKATNAKVPRSIWEPRPMTKAIQSSSSDSESEGSDYSVDTVICQGAGPRNTATLRSAHV